MADSYVLQEPYETLTIYKGGMRGMSEEMSMNVNKAK